MNTSTESIYCQTASVGRVTCIQFMGRPRAHDWRMLADRIASAVDGPNDRLVIDYAVLDGDIENATDPLEAFAHAAQKQLCVIYARGAIGPGFPLVAIPQTTLVHPGGELGIGNCGGECSSLAEAVLRTKPNANRHVLACLEAGVTYSGRKLFEAGIVSNTIGTLEQVLAFAEGADGLAARVEALRRANAENVLDSSVSERFRSPEELAVQSSKSIKARLDISRQKGEGLAELAIDKRLDATELALRESGVHGAGVRSFVMRLLVDAFSTVAGSERVAKSLGATDEELTGTGQTEDLRINLEQMNRHLQQISDNTGRSGTARLSVDDDN